MARAAFVAAAMRGASVIFQDPTLVAYYDKGEQADRRSTERQKVINCWPPPECLALIFKRQLDDDTDGHRAKAICPAGPVDGS
jgi:hypothetical protein